MRGIELTPEVPVAEIGALGAEAEETGFDTAFCSSHYNNRNPFVALDRVATQTSDIQVGPGVANPYETHPVTLASQAATLQEASDGRAVFGIGAGDRSTLENLGVEHERPLRRVLESFQVARDLWSGERVQHDGTFVARDAGLNFDVDSIPVYVGAQGPQMLRMAAKHADGVLVNAAHPRDVSWAREQIDDGLDARPEDREELDVVVYASVSVAESADAARRAAKPAVAFITAGASEHVQQRHGIDTGLADSIGASIARGEFSEAESLVSDRMLEAFAITGTPDTAAASFESLLEDADGIVAASPLGPEIRESVSLVGAALDRAETE